MITTILVITCINFFLILLTLMFAIYTPSPNDISDLRNELKEFYDFIQNKRVEKVTRQVIRAKINRGEMTLDDLPTEKELTEDEENYYG